MANIIYSLIKIVSSKLQSYLKVWCTYRPAKKNNSAVLHVQRLSKACHVVNRPDREEIKTCLTKFVYYFNFVASYIFPGVVFYSSARTLS